MKKSEEAWDVLARRNLLGEAEIMQKCQESGQVADFTIAEFEEKASADFMRALSELPTEQMHKLYIAFCMERLKLNSKFLNEERFARLNEAFKLTDTKFGLSLELLIEWIETLLRFGKLNEAVTLIQRGLDQNKNNATLWKHKLSVEIDQTAGNDGTSLFKLFYKAIECVKEKESLELWRLILTWCIANESPETEKMLKEGSQVTWLAVSSLARVKYLTFAFRSGLAKVRSVYNSLRKVPPYDLAFILKYIECERSAAKVDDARVTAAYEDAVLHFGTRHVDLWLAYLEYKRERADAVNTVSQVYWRAMKQLDAESASQFAQRVCLLNIKVADDDITADDIEME